MTYKKPRLWVLLAAFVAAPAFAQNVAVVNGKPIPESYVDVVMGQFAAHGQADSPKLRKAVGEELVNRELMMQQALREGIANRPDVKAQIAVARQAIIVQAFIEDFAKKHAPTDAETKARYDERVKEIKAKELHLHHILVSDEKTAKDLIAKIKGGASFEDLAKKYSKDPESAEHGGDLGWSNPSEYVPAFALAAEHLKKGEMTDTPVHTQFGWHIIRLDDSRPIAPPPFEQVKLQFARQIEQERLQQYVEKLRSQAKVQ